MPRNLLLLFKVLKFLKKFRIFTRSTVLDICRPFYQLLESDVKTHEHWEAGKKYTTCINKFESIDCNSAF